MLLSTGKRKQVRILRGSAAVKRVFSPSRINPQNILKVIGVSAPRRREIIKASQPEDFAHGTANSRETGVRTILI